jgi:hypothetical protein
MTRGPRVGVATATSTAEVVSCSPTSTLCSGHSMCASTQSMCASMISCPGAAVGSSPADRRRRAGHARGVADVCCDREWSRVPARSRAGGFRLFVDDLPKETGRPPGLTARIETRGSQRHGRGGRRRRCQAHRGCSGRARDKNVPLEPVWRSCGTFPLHQDGNVPRDRSRKPGGTFPDIPRPTEPPRPTGLAGSVNQPTRRHDRARARGHEPRSCSGTRQRATLVRRRAATSPARRPHRPEYSAGSRPRAPLGARTAPMPPPPKRARSVIQFGVNQLVGRTATRSGESHQRGRPSA